MKRVLLSTAFFLVVGVHPVAAQPDVVAHVKNDLVSRGVSLAGTCGAFEITRRVIWLLRSEGWGPVRKVTGDQCGGFSGDKMVATSGRFVDLLIDQGGANTPAWQERQATAEELAARVDPMDPGDAATPGPPIPNPPPTSADLSAVLTKLAELQAEDRSDQAQLLQKLDALEQKVDAPGWFTKIASNRYVQMAVAALGTCAASPDCRRTLFRRGGQ